MTDRRRAQVAALTDQPFAEYADGPRPGAWWVPARFGVGPHVAEAEAYLDGVRSGWGRRPAAS